MMNRKQRDEIFANLIRARDFYAQSPDGQWDDYAVAAISAVLCQLANENAVPNGSQLMDDIAHFLPK
jgi:hypothetical protein